MVISPDDEQFLNAMVALAHWRSAHPKEGPEHEPKEISDHRLLVMNRISALREGDIDPWMGKPITILVRKSTRFIVYLDDDLEVQWWRTQRLVEEEDMSIIQANVMRLTYASKFLLDQHNDLRGTWMPESAFTRRLVPAAVAATHQAQIRRRSERARDTATGIRMLVGESMAMALNGVKRPECEKVQTLAEEQILVAKDQLCRGVFFWEFVLALAAIVGAWMVFLIFANFMAAYHYDLYHYAPSFSWYQAALSGAFGAMLFSATRSNSLNLEPDSGRRGLRMEAYSRALIGAGAGLLVHFAFDAEIILKSALKTPEIRDAAHAFLCIASGWSERILPSLLTRAEGLVSDGGGAGKQKGKQ